MHIVFVSIQAVFQLESVGARAYDTEAEFFVKSTGAGVAFQKREFDDLNTLARLCRRDHFAKEGGADAEIPILLKDRDPDRSAVRDLYTSVEAYFAVARDLSVNKSGDGKRIF